MQRDKLVLGIINLGFVHPLFEGHLIILNAYQKQFLSVIVVTSFGQKRLIGTKFGSIHVKVPNGANFCRVQL